jgi:hypothetical protein
MARREGFLLVVKVKEFAAKEKLEIVKERGEPRRARRAANYGGLLSPPAAAKNVRTNLSMRSHIVCCCSAASAGEQ